MRYRYFILILVIAALVGLPVAAGAQSAEEWNIMGDDQYDAGDYKTAIEYYTKAIELAPKESKFYSDRGAAYNELGEYDKALVDLNKAIELDPNNEVPYNNRGYSYYMLGDVKRARIDFKKACDMGLEPACENYEAIK